MRMVWCACPLTPSPQREYHDGMRITLNLDAEAYALAKAKAASERTSLGAAVSSLVLQRTQLGTPPVVMEGGLPVFNIPSGTKSFGPEDLRRAEEHDEGLRYAPLFAKKKAARRSGK